MVVKQLSVFLENRAGQLCEVLTLLAEKGINIRALNIAETTDYGVLRLIVDTPEPVAELLRQQGILVQLSPVVAAAVPDRPGGLHGMLDLLRRENVDISYLYSVFGHGDNALMLFRVDDPAGAEEILRRGGIETDVLRKE